MDKTLVRTFSIATTLVAASVVSSTAVAHGDFLLDRDGNMVTDGFGECVSSYKLTHRDGVDPKHCVTPKKVAAKPKPAPAPKPVVREDITLGAHALFNHDKSSLRPEGIRELDDLAAKLKSFSSIQNINVVGHTDSQGTDAYNQGLSERRAASVKAYLVQQGISGSVISTSGSGESSPATSNATAEGRQQNRRVEIGIRATK